MSTRSEIRTSTPGMDAWRPQGDVTSYGDAAWLGAGLGIALHATIHFFSVFMPALEPLLVVFAPVENFAFTVAADAEPLARWMLLLVSLAAFWSLVACGLLAVCHEIGALFRVRSARQAPAGKPALPMH